MRQNAVKTPLRSPSFSERRGSFGAHFRDFTGLGRSLPDAALFLLTVSIFCHWALTALVWLGFGIYVLCSRSARTAALRPRGMSLSLLLLLGVFSLFSLLRGNALSALVFLLISVVVLIGFWVRSFMSARRYERMLDLCVVASFFSAAVGILQRFVLPCEVWDPVLLALQQRFVPDSVWQTTQVSGTTVNANYFGLQLAMVILVALFRLFSCGFGKRSFLYLACALVNFFALLLSESVASLFGLLFGLLFLLFFFRLYKTFAGMLGALTSLFTLGIFLPSSPWSGTILYPILERMELWKIALRALRQDTVTLLFGEGLFSFQRHWDVAPRSFWDVRGVVPREFQPHAHSLYAELLLSVGILGVLALFAYCLYQLFLLLRRSRIPTLRPYSVFFLILLAMCLIANVADTTLFWIQSGFLFLLCGSCIGIPVTRRSGD